MQNHKETWNEGLKSEVAFWRDVLSGKDQRFNAELKARANPDAPLKEALLELLPRQSIDECRILDVAAGPVSWCGWMAHGARVTIIPVDALADIYNQLLDEYGFAPPIRTIPGQAETLSRQFAAEHFDVVHILNALDHCYDPLLAVREMLLVTKSSGAVLIHGNLNEAEEAKYDGLHQWNIDVQDNRLVFWNKAASIDVAAQLPGVSINVESWPSDRWMKAVITKNR